MTKNISKKLEKKSLSELKEILKQLKLYKDLTKKLGNRGKAIFDSIINGKSLYKVEYFPAISEKKALKEALKAYEKVFLLDVDKEDIVLKQKENLDGGIRVFKDDNLLDLSFNRIEKLIKN